MIVLVSGTWISDFDPGSATLTRSGGLKVVVVMKKMSRRNATSTIGVMSILIPIRLATVYDPLR